jgi:hypothetical protein
MKLETGEEVKVIFIDNDDYYQTHTLGAQMHINDLRVILTTEETKQLIALLVDTLN